jgi:hypothetical protein
LVLLILVRHREVMGVSTADSRHSLDSALISFGLQNELIKVRSQSRWGLEALALMYGTPFSLVIWA